MRIDIEWNDIPVEVRIINTPPKYNFVDPTDISGFKGAFTRSRYSSFSSRQNVVDVKGEFNIGVRNGIGDMYSIVNEITIPALEIELSVTEIVNREYKDSEEEISTQEKILDTRDFEELENYSNAPDLNVTEIRIAIDYETKEVTLDREYGGIEWGQYYA